MITKVTAILNTLATDEALTRNKEMNTIVESNDHVLNTIQGLMNTLRSNNVQMGGSQGAEHRPGITQSGAETLRGPLLGKPWSLGGCRSQQP